MKKSLFVFFVGALVLAMSFSVIAAVPADYVESPYPVGTMGETLLSSQISDPRTFNTHIAKETSSTDVINQFLTSFTRYDPHTAELVPHLAKGWDFSDDGLEWTFYLREGAKWSDGTPITAYDAEFTFDVIYDENVPTSSRDILQVAGQYLDYEVIDDYTFRLFLPEPFAPLLNSMPQIVPKHALYDAWEAGDYNETWSINTPPSEIIGSDAFMLGGYRPGERVVLLRNPNFWQVNERGEALPYITRWIMQVVESQDAASLSFEAGETHVNSVRPADYARYRMNERNWDMQVHNMGPTFSTLFVTFNQNPRAPHFEEEPYKLEWFTNLHFRRAVAHAVDKPTMIDQLYDGLATPQWSPVSAPNEFFLNPDVPTYEYNLDAAREELEKGGFTWDAQGRLFDDNGNRVSFIMTTNAGVDVREGAGNLLQADLQELGMDVTFTPVDFNYLVNQLVSEFNWDCIIIGLTGGLEPHGGRNVWHSSGGLHMWNPVQDEPATEWEARIDEIFDEASTTLDQEERQALYYEFQEIVAEQLPLIYTVVQDSLLAVRNTLGNADPTIVGGWTHNKESLFIER